MRYYQLHLAHAGVAGHREHAVEQHRSGEAPVPELGGAPPEEGSRSGNGKDAREGPCRRGFCVWVIIAGGGSPSQGRSSTKEVLPAGSRGSGQGPAEGPGRPGKAIC